jgi:hypothetical protein
MGMSVSWQMLYKRLQDLEEPEESGYLGFLYHLFDKLCEVSRDLTERHGKGMDSVETSPVMSWLQSLLKKLKLLK